MASTRSDRVRRALTEFGVIVVGVLVALWIDAGWNWMQDRQAERILLDDLRTDFRANLEMVRDVAARRNAAVVHGTRLFREGVDAFPADSLDLVAQTLLATWTLNPLTGGLESALSAGRIDLLRNDELRTALAGWSGYLSDAEEETQQMMPRIIDMYVVTSPARLRGMESRELLGLMLDHPEVAGVVAMKVQAYEVTAAEVNRLLSETERIVDLLDAELDGGASDS